MQAGASATDAAKAAGGAAVDAAKADAAKLASDLGFEPKDAGGLAIARLLEPFAMLWIHLAMRQGFGTGFAFKLMKR